MEGQASDNYFDIMPFIEKKRRISDLTEGDIDVILRTLVDFRRCIEDIGEDLPTGLISGLEQLRKKLEEFCIPVCTGIALVRSV